MKSAFGLIQEGWSSSLWLLGRRDLLLAYLLCLGGLDVFNALQAASSLASPVGPGLAIIFGPSLTIFMKVFVLLILSGQSPVFTRRRWKDLWRVWAVNAVSGLYILLGLVCFIVPGIILWFRYWYASEVTLLEHRSIRGALARSGELAELNSGRSFLSTVVIFLTYLISCGIAQALLFFVSPSAASSFPFQFLIQILGSGALIWMMGAIYAAYRDADATLSVANTTDNARAELG